ncbi:MAG: cytochrome c [Rhizobiaceae bacterium]|nr:cytochrome c [Rhizobiaceae bacterium]
MSTFSKIGFLVVFAAGLAAAIFAFVTFSGGQDAYADALLKPNNKVLVNSGREIYNTTCASCHGKNLEGQPDWRSPDEDGLLPAPPHDQSGHTWHHTDKLLFELTKIGLGRSAGFEDYKTNMPVFEDVLSDVEIIAVLSYIKSTWPEEIRLRHDELNSFSDNQ